MRKLVKITLGVLVLAAVGWAGYAYFGPEKAPAGGIAAGTAVVVTGTVESVVTAQGKLEPKDYVDVGAQVSGLVEKLHADIGDVVKQGDLIAEIDPDVYESQVQGDEARLKTMDAQRAEQLALINQAQQKFDRNQKLIKDKAISKEVLEDAQTSLDIAKAKLMSLDAQIEEAQSTLEGNKANLSYTKIYAPMNGTVVSQSVKEGQTINANQTAPVIVQVANLDIMTVRAQVAEADVMKLSTGMPVYFSTLGSQGRRWEGTVRQILPSPENINDVVLYNVLVDVENEDRQLMTGMTTQLFFVLGRAENVPVVPMAALTKRVPESDTAAGKAYEVKLSGRDTTPRIVIIGISDRARAAVIEGLQEGDEIILKAPQAPAEEAASSGRGMRGMRGMARL
ncbi:MAG: efflux RND transporter periplasmic adaptor subunit [Alphaproteobacteria bacterium]|nr:efflux RND transporter periplasmic adaptor subunit [Alphaproteobacteria bacterium]